MCASPGAPPLPRSLGRKPPVVRPVGPKPRAPPSLGSPPRGPGQEPGPLYPPSAHEWWEMRAERGPPRGLPTETARSVLCSNPPSYYWPFWRDSTASLLTLRLCVAANTCHAYCALCRGGSCYSTRPALPLPCTCFAAWSCSGTSGCCRMPWLLPLRRRYAARTCCTCYKWPGGDYYYC